MEQVERFGVIENPHPQPKEGEVRINPNCPKLRFRSPIVVPKAKVKNYCGSNAWTTGVPSLEHLVIPVPISSENAEAFAG